MPFARMLAGHADYTPVVFGERRKETSWAHQIATAVVLTSPLLVYRGNPSSLLFNPAADLIKSIPSVWDETLVLAPSEIGGLAVFARRRGDTWFVAALNGPEARTITVDPAFLASGTYKVMIVRDNLDQDGAEVVETREARRGQPLEIPMRAAGASSSGSPGSDSANSKGMPHGQRKQGDVMIHWRVIACVAPAVLLLGDAPSGSQDRAAVVPEMKVLLHNDRVRVQFHDVAVGETTPMHSHPAYVAYVFNAYTGKAILADGTEVTMARKPGDVFYGEPVTHKIQNTGKTPIHNLIVELKETSK